MKDPLVEEFRKYRMEHTKRFNFNLHDICEDLRKLEKELYVSASIDKNNKIANITFWRTTNR